MLRRKGQERSLFERSKEKSVWEGVDDVREWRELCHDIPGMSLKESEKGKFCA